MINYIPEAFLYLLRTRIIEDEVIVAVVIDVVVGGNQVDVLKSDVDPDAGLPEPEEVRHLSSICHIVGRLEVTSAVAVLHEKLRMGFRSES